MKSIIPAKFQKNESFWDGRIFKDENLDTSRIFIVSASCGRLVCFTSCPGGNQVDDSPHVVQQKLLQLEE